MAHRLGEMVIFPWEEYHSLVQVVALGLLGVIRALVGKAILAFWSTLGLPWSP